MAETTSKVLVLDFGSQYTQLIARRIREAGVYCEIHRPEMPFEDVKRFQPCLVVLSGGPDSVTRPGSPRLGFPYSRFAELKNPKGMAPLTGVSVLGICYGMQLMAQENGGTVGKGRVGEYGFGQISWADTELSRVLKRTAGSFQKVWMSHGDSVTKPGAGFSVAASSEDVGVVSMVRREPTRFDIGFQFHPEVTHTEQGAELLKALLFDVAHCERDWASDKLVHHLEAMVKTTVGPTGHVLMGLSGGVDSTVAAVLISRVIGDRLHCVFVDHGLMRLHEREQVMASYEKLGLQVECVDASKRFLTALKGETDPEKKRKIIGRVFIEVFAEASARHKECGFLGQGTLYPDVIESTSTKGPSHTIKSHHNVGGLPENMPFKLVEPLRELFKDEVRRLGHELRIPKDLLGRHPFPGPGLSVRIMGDVTEEKVSVLQRADAIFIDALRTHHLYDKIWQAFVVLTNTRSVGVKGDARAYGNVVVLRAVTSVDGMTADWFHFDAEFLRIVSQKILNEVPEITRVTLDISPKPPATIEWE